MNRFFSFAYGLITRLAAIVLIPAIFLKGLFQDRSFLEHLGTYGNKSANPGDKSIWIHCSSVGEVKIASAVIEEIRKAGFRGRIVLTVVTPTGRKVAHDLVDDDIEVLFFPLDLKSCLKRAFEYINPERIALTETELYPNLIAYAIKTGSKLLIINGRISDSSYHKYLAIREWLGPMLKKFALIIMQSHKDLQKIIALGANPCGCQVVDNIKYDLMRKQLHSIDPKKILNKLGLQGDEKIVVAGSTRGGEERILAHVYIDLKRKYPKLKLIIAPRHLDRIGEVQTYLHESNLRYILRSRITDAAQSDRHDVIILDSIGEQTSVYSIAQAAFVGGSLVHKGGQNPLEPIGLGIPTCFGPHMENFADIAATVLNLKLASVVRDRSELYEFFDSVFTGETKLPDPQVLFNKFGKSAEYSARQILES